MNFFHPKPEIIVAKPQVKDYISITSLFRSHAFGKPTNVKLEGELIVDNTNSKNISISAIRLPLKHFFDRAMLGDERVCIFTPALYLNSDKKERVFLLDIDSSSRFSFRRKQQFIVSPNELIDLMNFGEKLESRSIWENESLIIHRDLTGDSKALKTSYSANICISWREPAGQDGDQVITLYPARQNVTLDPEMYIVRRTFPYKADDLLAHFEDSLVYPERAKQLFHKAFLPGTGNSIDQLYNRLAQVAK